MAYFTPYIDATGMHIPTYADIVADLVAQAQAIFGPDVYLGNDSQDYEFISIVAVKIYDALQLAQEAYNARSPGTAIGVGLDTLIKLNGLARNVGTYSTCVVVMSGTPGVTINNGVAQDKSGYKWAIPSVTFGSGGTATATATCTQAGPIVASIGDICEIATPTYGWHTITNEVVATPGVNTETDSELRGRQAYSTAKPSRTVLEGTKGAIAEVLGVTRFVVYENDTNEVDSNGLPPHSITVVVEGGDPADIAQAVFGRKGPGCYTNGTSSETITDRWGQDTMIGYYRPTYVDIDVSINVKALSGYTTATTDAIRAALVAYLDSLAIGDDLTISSLWGAALSVMTNLAKPTFSITGVTACIHEGTPGTDDIEVAFNEAVRGNTDYITINVT